MRILTTLQALYGDIVAAPTITETTPPGSANFLTAAGWVRWGGGLLCVVGLIAAGVMMAVSHRRGSGGEHGSAVGYVAAGSILVGIASQVVTGLGA